MSGRTASNPSTDGVWMRGTDARELPLRRPLRGVNNRMAFAIHPVRFMERLTAIDPAAPVHHFIPQPDQFQPDRWTDAFEQSLPGYAYFPFGGGPRICIGKHFALMEARLVLATLCRDWQFRRVSATPIDQLGGITMRPKGVLR